MMKSNNNLDMLYVLMVDDNMGFIERMKAMLGEVTNVGVINVASDFTEALRAITDEQPDVVLLDINLPGKNGIEVLKKIRLASSDCTVIMLTNHADEYYRQQCKELGSDYFLDKSNDFGKVPEIISKIKKETVLC